jgi:RNA polymerase-interacting CarD/CdnL/TRCF family regulator
VVKRLELPVDDAFDEEERHARSAALRAAARKLQELKAYCTNAEALAAVELERRISSALFRTEPEARSPDSRTVLDAAYKRMRQEVIRAERIELLELWKAGKLDDHSLRRIERDLDLQEVGP